MKQTFLTVLLLLSTYNVCVAQREAYPFQRGDGDLISALSWSPRNDLILTSSGDENGLRLWEVNSGKLLWKTDVGFLQDELELYSIRHSAWTNDQRLIVTGTDSGKLQLWDATNGKLIWNIKAHAGSVAAIAISLNSTLFVSAAELGDWKSELKVWNLADGKLIRDLSAGQKDISAVRFIDEDRFQTGNGFGQVTTWSTSDFKVINTKQLSPCSATIAVRTAIVYSPDFSLLAAQCRTKLVIQEAKTNSVLRTMAREENSRRVSFSSDSTVLLLPDSEIFHIRTATKSVVRDFDDGVLNHNGSLVAAFPSYRADGVQIFDTRTGKRRFWLVGHPGIIKSLAFSSDGKRFFSGSADRVVRVWDTESRTVLFSLQGHTDAIEWLEPGNDGRTLISQSENEEIVWDVQLGVKVSETRKTQRFEHNRRRALSPSGKLALVEEHEKPFRLVDQLTDRTIREFIFIDQLDNMVFCPDEKHFLAKPWWGGWQLWHIDGSKPIREFDLGYSFYNRVAFHPNGRIFITGGEGQNIFMFDLESGDKIWSLFQIDQEELESKKAAEVRRVTHIANEKERARLADIQNEAYANRVYIRFSHYGDMTPLGEQRIAETDTPNKSTVKKAAKDANAIWLRLHNDSPLPISVPTQSMYLPSGNCFHEFSTGEKISGLCDNREISVWLGLEDKDGQPLPYGFDFGSSVILLPGKSVLFAVSIDALRDGRAIRFAVTFQKPDAKKNVENYGNERLLRLRESDLPGQ
ncbi:MAG TPA: PQQ-binding-like beta-propeller repeat protein [Pyrinomonadaceae bacterium]|nr:PQQ-binding-like beta-propeller repeat protein [Pyrinomonadaceae bacterium]